MDNKLLSLHKAISSIQNDFATIYINNKLEGGFGELEEEVAYLIQYIHSVDLAHCELGEIASEAFLMLNEDLENRVRDLDEANQQIEDLETQNAILQEEVRSLTKSLDFFRGATNSLEKSNAKLSLSMFHLESTESQYRRTNSLNQFNQKSSSFHEKNDEIWKEKFAKLKAENCQLNLKIKGLEDQANRHSLEEKERNSKEFDKKEVNVIYDNFEISFDEAISPTSSIRRKRGCFTQSPSKFGLRDGLKSTFKDSYQDISEESRSDRNRRFDALLSSFREELKTNAFCNVHHRIQSNIVIDPVNEGKIKLLGKTILYFLLLLIKLSIMRITEVYNKKLPLITYSIYIAKVGIKFILMITFCPIILPFKLMISMASLPMNFKENAIKYTNK